MRSHFKQPKYYENSPHNSNNLQPIVSNRMQVRGTSQSENRKEPVTALKMSTPPYHFINIKKGSYLKSEVYRGVYSIEHSLNHGSKESREKYHTGRVYWGQVMINRRILQTSKIYNDERSAALALDKLLLKAGLEPINILKKAS